MSKKNEISLNIVSSYINGVFDVNENGDYIITVEESEILLKDLEEYFLGGSITLSNVRNAKDGE